MSKKSNTNTKSNLALMIGGGMATLFVAVFGTSILSNLHLRYLRSLGNEIVRITNSTGAGATGFMIKGKSGKTYIMTNNHVCGLQEDGYVNAEYQGDTYKVKVVKSYPTNDLCAIEAPNTVKSVLTTAYTVRNGESIYIIGHPLLDPLSIKSGELAGEVAISISVGANIPLDQCSGPTYRVIDTSGTMYDVFFGVKSICVRDLIADSASLDSLPGNSGSPVVNIFGSVVGVLFAGHESGTRSYNVPLHDLKDFLNSL